MPGEPAGRGPRCGLEGGPLREDGPDEQDEYGHPDGPEVLLDECRDLDHRVHVSGLFIPDQRTTRTRRASPPGGRVVATSGPSLSGAATLIPSPSRNDPNSAVVNRRLAVSAGNGIQLFSIAHPLYKTPRSSVRNADWSQRCFRMPFFCCGSSRRTACSHARPTILRPPLTPCSHSCKRTRKSIMSASRTASPTARCRKAR